jgi:15-cis-phytoene synthase
MQVSHQITRKSASNLALAFILLPKCKRDEMVALYAFCREIDDVADEEQQAVELRRMRLMEWREDIHKACSGESPQFPVNRELQSVIHRRHLPFELFDELLKGVEMDLDIARYQSMEELEKYCYRVASVVGLLSIEIFEYKDPHCRDYAIHLGKALQLTNILRDVRNDADRGRIYLPLAECKKFGVSEADILSGKYSAQYARLAQSIGERAKYHYSAARKTLPDVDQQSMATAELMGSVYWGLLRKLERRRYNVFDFGQTRLTRLQKIYLISRMWYQAWRGHLLPSYGGQ